MGIFLTLQVKSRRKRPAISTDQIERQGKVMVNTGLSSIVAGHLIYVQRNEAMRKAKVVAQRINGDEATPVELHAIRVTADLLARRAQRVFGRVWTVDEWDGTVEE